MLAAWVLAAQTGIGLIPDDRFWNVAGVPILPQQIVLTGLLLLLVLPVSQSLVHNVDRYTSLLEPAVVRAMTNI